jgi:hypothetical protein
MSSFRPFSVGRHSCIGMKLAYAEMRLIIARLLWAFDIRLKDEADRWDWGEQDTFVLWVGALLGAETARRADERSGKATATSDSEAGNAIGGRIG